MRLTIAIFAACYALSVPCGAHAEQTALPCSACHAQATEAFEHSSHSHAACTDCHGDPAEHLRAPGTPGSILAFDAAPAETINAACGGCHKDKHGPGATIHERAGLACTNCHSLHHERVSRPLPAEFGAVDANSAIFLGCHQDNLAQFAFNERHRLAEGALSCTSCHDPHAARSSAQLGSAKSQMCKECHARNSGPFVFEHPASTVDGCTACHEPHGSPNRHMLNHQRVGELCFSCHAMVPQFHLGSSPASAPRFDENTVCTNCHSAIHGSNLDLHFLR